MNNYKCMNVNCLHKFEAKKPGFLGGPVRCPRCDTTDVLKVPSVPAIIFKGKGFYKTEGKK